MELQNIKNMILKVTEYSLSIYILHICIFVSYQNYPVYVQCTLLFSYFSIYFVDGIM